MVSPGRHRFIGQLARGRQPGPSATLTQFAHRSTGRRIRSGRFPFFSSAKVVGSANLG